MPSASRVVFVLRKTKELLEIRALVIVFVIIISLELHVERYCAYKQGFIRLVYFSRLTFVFHFIILC